MNSERIIETSISVGNVKDQIISLLYSFGIIKDNEEVLELNFNTKCLKESEGVIPLTLKVAKEEEVKYIKLNG